MGQRQEQGQRQKQRQWQEEQQIVAADRSSSRGEETGCGSGIVKMFDEEEGSTEFVPDSSSRRILCQPEADPLRAKRGISRRGLEGVGGRSKQRGSGSGGRAGGW
eukprot:750080-Hanusia_phi.AAC.2